MKDGFLQDLTAISVIVGIVGGLVTAWRAVAEYRLKSQAQRAQLDIDLARHFAEVVPIANGRSGYLLSEAAVTAIVENNPPATEDDLAPALITQPVGVATQAAAIRSLGFLGSRHDSLSEPAQAALETLAFADEVPALASARRAALETLAQGPVKDRK
jgi:hypothetical protein